MSYIDLINAFWAKQRECRFSTNEIALYFALLDEANRVYWKTVIELSDAVLCEKLSFGSRNTLYKAREGLAFQDLILFNTGGRGINKTTYMLTKESENVTTQKDVKKSNCSKNEQLNTALIVQKMNNNCSKNEQSIVQKMNNNCSFFEQLDETTPYLYNKDILKTPIRQIEDEKKFFVRGGYDENFILLGDKEKEKEKSCAKKEKEKELATAPLFSDVAIGQNVELFKSTLRNFDKFQELSEREKSADLGVIYDDLLAYSETKRVGSHNWLFNAVSFIKRQNTKGTLKIDLNADFVGNLQTLKNKENENNQPNATSDRKATFFSNLATAYERRSGGFM